MGNYNEAETCELVVSYILFKCRITNILYKCVASTNMKPDKVYVVNLVVKNLSTTVLIVMTKQSPNTVATSKTYNKSCEMVHSKDRSIIFEFNK